MPEHNFRPLNPEILHTIKLLNFENKVLYHISIIKNQSKTRTAYVSRLLDFKRPMLKYINNIN